MFRIRKLGRILIRILTPLSFRILVGNYIRSRRRSKEKSEVAQSIEISKLFSITQILVRVPILQESKNPTHEFLILSSNKHKDLAFQNIQNLTRVYGEHVKINLIFDGAEEEFFEGQNSEVSSVVKFYRETVFASELENLKTSLMKFNPDRFTWLWQQCMKTIFVARSSCPVVILDADTFITEKIDFLNDGKSILLAGSKEHFEFHAPYSRHVERFLGIQTLPINFTHHCQLQIPERVREIYSQDPVVGLQKWLSDGVKTLEFSPVGEYQTYGEFMRASYPSEIALLNPRHHIFLAQQGTAPGVLSISEGALLHQQQRCEGGCSLFTIFL